MNEVWPAIPVALEAVKGDGAGEQPPPTHSTLNSDIVEGSGGMGSRWGFGGNMGKFSYAFTPLGVVLFASLLPAQTAAPAKVDFGKDVLPILRQNCVSCRGPSQQNAGLRLDRRSSVFKVGTRRIVPGSSD